MTERQALTSDEITIIVDRAVKNTLTTLGFDISTPKDLRAHQDDFRYLRNQRLGSEEMAKWVKRSLIGACVTGALYALWSGLRAALTMKGIGS